MARTMLTIAPGALGAYTASRATDARYVDVNGVVQDAAVNVPRDGNYEQGVRTILLEGSGTNQLHSSANFDAASADWNAGSDFTVTTVPSIIAGQLAYQHTNLGTNTARARTQTIGTLTGAAETTSIILENVNAVTSRFGLFDVTTGLFVVAVDFTWATHTAAVVAGAGTVRVVDRGGGRYRISVTGTGTAGHTRRIVIYPTGVTQNTLAAILHHAQHEEASFASSPIVTPVGATASRSADLAGWTIPDAPHAMEWAMEFFEHGAAAAGFGTALLGLSNDAHSGAFAELSCGGGTYIASHNNGSVQVNVNLPSEAIGTRVKLRMVLAADGSVQLFKSVNGGAEVASTASAATPFAAAWGGQTVRLNSLGTGLQSNAAYISATLTNTRDPAVDHLASHPSAALVVAGQTVQLRPLALTAANVVVPGVNFTYSSSAPSVATVSATGLVTAVAAGTATITVTCEGVSTTMAIRVRAAAIAALKWAPLITYNGTPLSLSLPMRPWRWRGHSEGGSDLSTAGVPESFIERHDQLVECSIRFLEHEWPAVEAWLRWARESGQSFTFQFDASDGSTAITCYLQSPALGADDIAPQPDTPTGVWMQPVTLRRTTSAAMDIRYVGT